MPNIATIARESGASLATVSRVLRQPEGAKTPIQERILEVARKLGYPRNGLSVGAKGRTRQILFLTFQNVLSDDVMSQILPSIMEGIDSVMSPLGYNLLFGNVNLANDAPPALVRGEMDGVIFHGRVNDDFYIRYLADIPHVGLQHYDPRRNCSWVALDQANQVFQGVEHFVRLGHRRIAYLTPERDFSYSFEQLRGYRQAMEFFGLPIHPEWEIVWQRPLVNGILPEEYEMPDFTEQLAPVFRGKEAPTAIFCLDNYRAAATAAALKRLGFRVPEDVSLIGTCMREGEDNFFTCICDDSRSTNAEAGRLLLRILSGEDTRTVRILVRPRLISKQSVLPAPTGTAK